MAIEFKDYYQILGVSRSAGDDEIRRAFRRLARLYHPDITGNDRRAEDKFKELNEAYEVLSDADKRRKYDDFSLHIPLDSHFTTDEAWANFGREGFQTRGGQNSSQHFTFTGAGFSDFFNELFGPNAGRNFDRSEPRLKSEVREDDSGADLETDLWVTLEEVSKGALRPVNIKRVVRCQTCYGMGQYNAHPCERCDGLGTQIRRDTYQVRVPQGIAEGALLRLAGKGEEGIQNGRSGDLYLRIRYAKHPEFHIEKGSLVYELDLAPWEAVLGTTATVPTLTSKVTLRVPPGTQGGQKLRVRARGLPNADGSTGDLLVHVKVQVPPATRERERELWQELARESAFHPREHYS